ncbi:MAG: hypothetical protein KDD34_03285 [Bdellovibrionales bacterium]|nr:hypothetical protein [Bdellovibrionales bacterium]
MSFNSKLNLFLIGSLFSFSLMVMGGESEKINEKEGNVEDAAKNKWEWFEHKPYVPEKYDYFVELGAMWEERNLYWMGAGFGRHLGKCVLSRSQTCQQYWDLLGGVGGRDGLTSLLFLTGPRWQYVNYPSPLSPSVRLLAGVMNIRDDARNKEAFAYGIGLGQTLSVHERIDVRLEARAGYADHVWYQGTAAIHIKMDQWVDYFASKLKEFGVEAVKVPGKVIEKTGSAIHEVLSKKKDSPKAEEKK